MEKFSTLLTVVAAAIVSPSGKFLLQRRPQHKAHGGLWEFPGGKVEAAETLRQALIREVNEELAIQLDEAALTPAGFAEQPAVEGRTAIVLLLYTCRGWSGEPRALEQQEWGWFGAAEAAALPMPPMDEALLRQLGGRPPATAL